MSTTDSPTTSPTLLQLLRNPITNELAWARFFERYRPLIQKRCGAAGLQADDAEEVQSRVMTSLVQALRRLEYDPDSSFRGWLRTVVLNTVRTVWRERHRKPGAVGSGDPAVHELLEQIEIPDEMKRLADELDESMHSDLRLAKRVAARVKRQVEKHTWKAYWLTEIEGQPADAVARKLGMTVTAVYVARSRVSRRLRKEGEELAELLKDDPNDQADSP